MTDAAQLPFTLVEKLQALQDSLLAANPNFVNILADIHKITDKQPEYVYMLSDEQIKTLVEGLSKHTGIVISATDAKSKNKLSKQQLSTLTADDI